MRLLHSPAGKKARPGDSLAVSEVGGLMMFNTIMNLSAEKIQVFSVLHWRQLKCRCLHNGKYVVRWLFVAVGKCSTEL
jgi:hypothetical protein